MVMASKARRRTPASAPSRGTAARRPSSRRAKPPASATPPAPASPAAEDSKPDLHADLQAGPEPEPDNVRLFADAYSSNGGNATAAYCAAHPTCRRSTAKVEGHKYLTKPNVRQAIERRRMAASMLAVMTRTQRQQLWTNVANDPTQPMAMRLRASELLGKSQADFVEVRVAPVVVDTQASEEELVDQVAIIMHRLQQRLFEMQRSGQLALPAGRG